jgi:hypothetical protein
MPSTTTLVRRALLAESHWCPMTYMCHAIRRQGGMGYVGQVRAGFVNLSHLAPLRGGRKMRDYVTTGAFWR